MIVGRALATSISGLNANALRVRVAATNIVNLNTPGFKAETVRTVSINTTQGAVGGSGVVAQVIESGNEVDLAFEFTRLIEAEAAYRAGVRVIQTIERIERETINILA